jgi:hypothetical protein
MTAKLELKTASGGKVILDPTDTAVDRTLTLPALSGSFVTADTSGNVGIGTSSPATNLTVGNASGANGIAITQRADSSTTSGMLFLSDSVGSASLRTVSGNLVVGTGATIGSSSGTERLRIDSAGNVGINTSDPQSKLQVVGDQIVVSGATALSNLGIQIKGLALDAIPAAQAQSYIATGSSSMGANGDLLIASRTNAATSIRFITGTTPAERARINSSGDLLVGVTSLPTQGANGTGIYGGSGRINIANNAASATVMAFYSSTQNTGTITTAATTTAYNTSSDYRLKNIEGAVTNSGEYIDSLKPVQGTWKADGSKFIGLIAHEAQEVSQTQVATGEKDGEEMQGMDYSNPEFIANIIAELQSLRARVAQLEGN